MGDTTIMIGTKEISLSKALKYYDDPMKCQRKLDLTEKEYKSLLNKMIKRVQGQESKSIPKETSKPKAPSKPSNSRSSTLHGNSNPGSNVNVNAIDPSREPVRFQAPIIQNDIMLPMPQPSYEASSNVNPVDGRTPIQAPLWFDMLAGETKPSVEHSKINAESIGHRQLSSQILPPQLKSESPRFQSSSQSSQFQHPAQAQSSSQSYLNSQFQHPAQAQSSSQSYLNSQFQHPAQAQSSSQSYLNSQFQHPAQAQSSMETDFNQPVQGAQPQFNPQQFRQQTTQSRSSHNLATSRVFDIGRTDFPAVISRVPHNTRIKTQEK
jgi:hypothetical protein